MKKILILLISCQFISNCSSKSDSYTNEIRQFQYELNSSYANSKSSPLTKEDLKEFRSLDFFKIDEKYKVIATLERTPNAPIISMQTTTSEVQYYKKFAITHFKIDSTNLQLNIYQSIDLINNPQFIDYLFLPFNDQTNGKSSYGGGRFIDLKLPSEKENTITIDFNKAYNPYCAYNHNFSCPIPPSENFLPIEINAGVKAFNNNH